MLKKIKKIIWPVIAVLPLVIGTIGYVKSGESFSDSLYGAVSLYGMNLTSDAYNVCIEIARWTAPLVTATAILAVIKSVWYAIKCRYILMLNTTSGLKKAQELFIQERLLRSM